MEPKTSFLLLQVQYYCMSRKYRTGNCRSHPNLHIFYSDTKCSHDNETAHLRPPHRMGDKCNHIGKPKAGCDAEDTTVPSWSQKRLSFDRVLWCRRGLGWPLLMVGHAVDDHERRWNQRSVAHCASASSHLLQSTAALFIDLMRRSVLLDDMGLKHDLKLQPIAGFRLL